MGKQTKSREYLVEDAILRLGTIVTTGLPSPSGAASETTLEAIRVLVNSLSLDDSAGVDRELTYYSGVVTGNPSGDKNIETLVYKEGATAVLTKTLTYDVDNDILTVTVT